MIFPTDSVVLIPLCCLSVSLRPTYKKDHSAFIPFLFIIASSSIHVLSSSWFCSFLELPSIPLYIYIWGPHQVASPRFMVERESVTPSLGRQCGTRLEAGLRACKACAQPIDITIWLHLFYFLLSFYIYKYITYIYIHFFLLSLCTAYLITFYFKEALQAVLEEPWIQT